MLHKSNSFRVRRQIDPSHGTTQRRWLKHARIDERVNEDLVIPTGSREPDPRKRGVGSCNGAAGDILCVVLPFGEYGTGFMVIDYRLAGHTR